MSPEPKGKREHRCDKCDKVFTSMMRLQHHRAAEHAPRTSRDIRTRKDIPTSTRDIPHRPATKSSAAF